MTYDKNTYDCKCNACGHEWRARTPHLPRKCPKCTSVKWNDSGNKKYPVIIARACGKEESGDRAVFCILDRIESPDIITEDIFYMTAEDEVKYLNGCRYPTGSALVFIGDIEIDEAGELIVNEMNLIYIHEKSFRRYVSSVSCGYNINAFYERQKAYKRYAELEEERQAGIEERRKANLEAQKARLEEDQERINMRRQILAEIEGE